MTSAKDEVRDLLNASKLVTPFVLTAALLVLFSMAVGAGYGAPIDSAMWIGAAILFILWAGGAVFVDLKRRDIRKLKLAVDIEDLEQRQGALYQKVEKEIESQFRHEMRALKAETNLLQVQNRVAEDTISKVEGELAIQKTRLQEEQHRTEKLLSELGEVESIKAYDEDKVYAIPFLVEPQQPSEKELKLRFTMFIFDLNHSADTRKMQFRWTFNFESNEIGVARLPGKDGSATFTVDNKYRSAPRYYTDIPVTFERLHEICTGRWIHSNLKIEQEGKEALDRTLSFFVHGDIATLWRKKLGEEE